MNEPTSQFRLIVDTNSYSGNFERQSVAYATGQVGECGVGDTQAEHAEEDLSQEVLEWWEDHVLHVADDDGCARPGNIWPTPGMFNDGLGGHFPTTEEGRAAGLAHFKNYKKRDLETRLAGLAGITLGQGGWTQEAVDRQRQDYEEQVKALATMDKVREWPAYQSVAVVVDEQPSQALLDSFEARMREYLAKNNVEVLAFRVEHEELEVRRREVFRR